MKTTHPPPPWKRFPDSEPAWPGWRQGVAEAWLLELFLPFWKGLDELGRGAYMRTWPAPDEAWREALERWRGGGA